MFLKKVKVKKLCFISKLRNAKKERVISFYEKNDEEFYIIGKTTIKEGFSIYEREYGYQFVLTKSHQVYIVSNDLNKRHFVLLEDVEVI